METMAVVSLDAFISRLDEVIERRKSRGEDVVLDVTDLFVTKGGRAMGSEIKYRGRRLPGNNRDYICGGELPLVSHNLSTYFLATDLLQLSKYAEAAARDAAKVREALQEHPGEIPGCPLKLYPDARSVVFMENNDDASQQIVWTSMDGFEHYQINWRRDGIPKRKNVIFFDTYGVLWKLNRFNQLARIGAKEKYEVGYKRILAIFFTDKQVIVIEHPEPRLTVARIHRFAENRDIVPVRYFREDTEQIIGASPGGLIFTRAVTPDTAYVNVYNEMAEIPGRPLRSINVFPWQPMWVKTDYDGRIFVLLRNWDDDRIVSVFTSLDSGAEFLFEFALQSKSSAIYVLSHGEIMATNGDNVDFYTPDGRLISRLMADIFHHRRFMGFKTVSVYNDTFVINLYRGQDVADTQWIIGDFSRHIGDIPHAN